MIEINGFITNLGRYNEGELIGKWVTFPLSEEEINKTLEEIGINEEYEEYFFTDWESDLNLQNHFGEYANIEEVNKLAKKLENVDDQEKLIAILEVITSDADKAIGMLDDYIFYEGMTLLDMAYDLMEECYDIPEIAKNYFDYEAFARDLEFDGYTETKNGVLVS